MVQRSNDGLFVIAKAEQFHSLWISSPGSLTRELRKHQAQIKRGDCTKGLERIGR